MRPEPTDNSTAPTTDDIRRVWCADRAIHDLVAKKYLYWIKRFRAYCTQLGLDERTELTRDGACRFVDWYARDRLLYGPYLICARSALHAFSHVYEVMALSPPPWRSPRPARLPATALQQTYAEHLLRHRGDPPLTIDKKLDHADRFEHFLADQGKTLRSMTLVDIDAFLVDCAGRFARATVSDIACSVRSFARFLFANNVISVDLAVAVIAPVQPRYERPLRALPWEDVQRILRAVDVSTPGGLRDYALLLMMSTYGFGGAEVRSLQLQDIDWDAGTLSIVRPKTGVAFTLPLLPAVGKALANYLCDGRPPGASTRHVFVQMQTPFDRLGTTSSSALRHVIIKHAKAAGVKASFLGSHVLRHSNAARHVDLGVQPHVLSDLLGHRDPESISAYVRIATDSLRDISLPVPL